MSHPALIVLDLDGTLVSLDVDWVRVRADLARELSARRLRAPAGVMATLRDLDERGERSAACACRRIVAAAELRGARRAWVNRALLNWLRDQAPDARVAVLTLNDRVAAIEAISRAGLKARIDDADVIGRDDAPPKPAPDGLLALLARHRIAPEQALLIGDSQGDLRCGGAAGVATLHVAEIGIEWAAGGARRGTSADATAA